MARNKYDVDEQLESPFNIKHLKRSMVYIKKFKKQMIIALSINAVAIVVSLFAPIITGYAIGTTIPNKNVPQLILLSLLFFLTIIISVLLSAKRSKIMTVVGQGIIFDIRKDLFAHLQKLSFQYYDDRPHGKILVRIINYVNSISDLLSNGLINFVLEMFNLVFIMIFMFFVSWQLALVVLAGVPVFLAIMVFLKKRQRKSWQKYSNKNSNLNAYLHESIVGTRVTQIFTREDENSAIFDNLAAATKNSWMKAQVYSMLIWPSVDSISTIITASLYVIGLLVIGPATVSLYVLVAMTGYSSRFWQPILNLSNLFNTFINNIAYLERIFETLDEPITVNDKESATTLPNIVGNLTFDNVTFAYDENAVILKDLTFNVKAGESIALVGATGAGKTTVVNLISRFYDVTAGRVLIDDIDISNVTLHSLRSQMGIMLQDSFIFSGTILDNIKYGKLDATYEEVVAACKTVRAHDFIMDMEHGYKTEVNERGSTLSQGQKQLISFARTLLSNPKILILDEATSSIDAKTERDLQHGLLELLKGRTSFIIAHRLSTIQNCDRIMYIGNKGIMESGSHEQLLKQKGEYYKLYTSQLDEPAAAVDTHTAVV